MSLESIIVKSIADRVRKQATDLKERGSLVSSFYEVSDWTDEVIHSYVKLRSVLREQRSLDA